MDLRHRHPYLEPHYDDGFVPFAHRGGSSSLPENSLAAFRAAVELGYRYLETDVHLTRDGSLVAFHDSNLQRTCGVNREISDMTLKEVRSARIAGREPIPLLEELFEEFPLAMFNIDAKSDSTVDPLVALLGKADALDRSCIGSFDHRRLVRIRALLGNEVCTSASPREVVSWMIGTMPVGPSCVQVPLRQFAVRVVTRRRVERSTRYGLPVHVWTIDDPHSIQELIDVGVSGIMTDEARVLKDIAAHNGLWR